MKKILSVILSVLMIVSVISIAGITVYASKVATEKEEVVNVNFQDSSTEFSIVSSADVAAEKADGTGEDNTDLKAAPETDFIAKFYITPPYAGLTPRTDVYMNGETGQTSIGNCTVSDISWTKQDGTEFSGKFEYDTAYKATLTLTLDSETAIINETNIEAGIDINDKNKAGSYKTLSVTLDDTKKSATVVIEFDAIPAPTPENTTQTLKGVFETLQKGENEEYLRGATVTAEDKNSGNYYNAQVTEDGTNGSFIIEKLPVGTYKVIIAKPGYLPYIYDDMIITPGRNVELDAGVLAVGSIHKNGAIGILDFTAYLRSFTENTKKGTEDAADIFKFGTGGIAELAQIKKNFEKVSAVYEVSEESRFMTLQNSYYRLTQDKELTVGWIGGSITQNAPKDENGNKLYKGYDEFFIEYLKENFPKAKIKRINAGISGTDTTYGIFRMEEMLMNELPDLVFVEFAANDSTAYGGDIATNYESLIRSIYEMNPMVDIVCVLTPMEGYEYNRKMHTKVAQYYNLPLVDVGHACEDINNVVGTYKATSYDNLHYTQAGYEVFNKVILDRFSRYFTGDKKPENPEYRYRLLPKKLNDAAFENPEVFDILAENVKLSEGQWTTNGSTGTLNEKLMGVAARTNVKGATAEFTFTGTAFGFMVEAYDTSRVIEYKVDKGEFKLFNPAYAKLGGARFIIAELGLKNEEHTVVLRATDYKGTAIPVSLGLFPTPTKEQKKAAIIPEAEKENYNIGIYAVGIGK